MSSLYVVYRHGSNAANQSMTPVMPVGTLEAKRTFRSRKERIDALTSWQAEHPAVTVYNNQYLTLIHRYHAASDDWDAACEADEWNVDREI